MSESLLLSPDPVLVSGSIRYDGARFAPKRRIQLAIDGVGWSSNELHADAAGTFHGAFTASSTPRTQTIAARYYGSTTIIASSPISVIAAPVVTPPVTDWTVVTGWRNVFHDDFSDRTVAKGDFIKGGTVVHWIDPTTGATKTAGTKTADSRYIAFGTPTQLDWRDTSGHGTYADSSIISIANGILDMAIYADANGYGHTCVITPLPVGGSARGGLVSSRSLTRFRADPLYGFKAVPLDWSDGAVNNNMIIDGEIDGPEGNLNGTPKGYLHYAPASSPSDQFVASYPAGTTFNAWHDFVTEWRAGQSVEWFLDGVSIGRVTSRIPTAAMHFNLQFETSTGTNAQIPVANTSGHVQIDRVGLWVPA